MRTRSVRAETIVAPGLNHGRRNDSAIFDRPRTRFQSERPIESPLSLGLFVEGRHDPRRRCPACRAVRVVSMPSRALLRPVAATIEARPAAGSAGAVSSDDRDDDVFELRNSRHSSAHGDKSKRSPVSEATNCRAARRSTKTPPMSPRSSATIQCPHGSCPTTNRRLLVLRGNTCPASAFEAIAMAALAVARSGAWTARIDCIIPA